MSSAELSLESRLTDLITRFVMLMQKRPFEATDEHLTLLGYRAAFLLYFNGTNKMTMGEIADKLYIAMPSATLLVDRLVERKYALREHDETDRRQVWVCLTQKGKFLVSHKLDTEKQRIEKILSLMSEKEKKAVFKFLDIALDVMAAESRRRERAPLDSP